MLHRFVTVTYILEFSHSLGEQPALNVAFIWVSRSLKPLVFLKSNYAGRSLFGLPCINHFPGQLLSCRRSAGSSLSDTLGTSSLVEDRSRDQGVLFFQFRSNLKDLRDYHDMLQTSIMSCAGCSVFAFPVQSSSLCSNLLVAV